MTIFFFSFYYLYGKGETKLKRENQFSDWFCCFFKFLFLYFFVTVSAGVELKRDETPVCGPIGNHQRFGGGDAGA